MDSVGRTIIIKYDCLIPFIAGKVGRKEMQNCQGEGLLHNLQRVFRVSESQRNPLHPG